MLVTNSTPTKRGNDALTYLQSQDSKKKTMNGSTSDVPAGDVKFLDKVTSVPYTDNRTGEPREYDAIVVKASDNKEYAVAFSALLEKEPIISDGKTIACPNLGEFDVPFADLYTRIKGKTATLIRVKGMRKSLKNGSLYRGRFEYFVNLR